jgi:hypothetical protein
VAILLPPLSADELLVNAIPPENDGVDENACELFFANNWSCVSEITSIDKSVNMAIIIVTRIVFGPTILLSSKCCIRKLFSKAV